MMNNKPIPGKTCPKCGAELIVKERKLRIRGGDDYITLFIACPRFDTIGCGHTEPLTDEVRFILDNAPALEVYDIGI